MFPLPTAPLCHLQLLMGRAGQARDPIHVVVTFHLADPCVGLKKWCLLTESPLCSDSEHPMLKRHLLLGRKAMTNLDSILKSRDIILPAKVHRVKAIVFPVVLYGCESWTIKKAEPQRIDAFKLWCWRRLLRVPWIARSSQSILKEINPEYSLEGLTLKLKL